MNKKIWLVPHPIYQFKEDVKLLARQNNLKIVDAKFAKDFKSEMIATEAPKLTKKAAKDLES